MVSMNIGALRDAEDGAGGRNGLAGMRESFAQIASNEAMFGLVPNADLAAQALRSAATAMLQELERAGQTVDDIRRSAAAAAGLGIDSDAAAKRALTQAEAAGWAAAGWQNSTTPLIPDGTRGG